MRISSIVCALGRNGANAENNLFELVCLYRSGMAFCKSILDVSFGLGFCQIDTTGIVCNFEALFLDNYLESGNEPCEKTNLR